MAKQLKSRKSEITIPQTKAGAVASDELPGDTNSQNIAIQGMMPAMQPNQNGNKEPVPGSSYFSCSHPKRIIEIFAAAIPINATMSQIELSIEINRIMRVEEIEYSIHRK